MDPAISPIPNAFSKTTIHDGTRAVHGIESQRVRSESHPVALDGNRGSWEAISEHHPGVRECFVNAETPPSRHEPYHDCDAPRRYLFCTEQIQFKAGGYTRAKDLYRLHDSRSVRV
jgi:hypothetical protein